MVLVPRSISHPMVLNIGFTPDLARPSTPTGPNDSRSQPPSPQPEAKSKKTNPLTELVDTEKLYVDQLAGIIRVMPLDYFYIASQRFPNGWPLQLVQKVASAWSRSNLPPQELDQMFRAVEAVYKANRSFLSVRNHALCPVYFG